MRIVIDGFPVRVGSAGIGTYTRELLGALTRVAPSHEYYLADTRPRLTSSRIPSGLAPGDFDAWIEGLISRVPAGWKALPAPLRALVTARQAARLGADVYLGTNFFGVFHRAFRTLIVVHDLSYAHDPSGTYPPMLRRLRRDLPRHVAMAHAIVADSESTKRDVVTHLRVPAARVHVVYPGVGPSFRPVTDQRECAACRSRYGLPERFLLHVGTIEPRKNQVRLLEAFRMLTDDPRFDLGLVLVGGKGWRDQAIVQAIEQSPVRHRIVLTGRVPQEHLPVLYSMAALFVFPSAYEGFGLPVLEAMACGTPVVSSNTSSLPEAAGDAALLVDPTSPAQIAQAIGRVISDTHLAASLRQRGLARAATFRWEASARTILQLVEAEAGR